MSQPLLEGAPTTDAGQGIRRIKIRRALHVVKRGAVAVDGDDRFRNEAGGGPELLRCDPGINALRVGILCAQPPLETRDDFRGYEGFLRIGGREVI
jgi:hypothetical protein